MATSNAQRCPGCMTEMAHDYNAEFKMHEFKCPQCKRSISRSDKEHRKILGNNRAGQGVNKWV